MKPLRRLLIATDFSACADAAAELTARLAEQLNAIVEVITIIDTSAITDAGGDPADHRQRVEEMCRQARERLQTFVDRHFREIEELHLHVFDGGLEPPNPSVEIIRVGETMGCDLIVLGTHGKTGLERLVLGSVAETVVRKSPIPVVTVRGPK